MLCDHYTGTLPSQWERERSYWVDACLERVPAFQGRRRMMGIYDMQLSRLPGQEFSTHRAIMAMQEEIRKLQRSQQGPVEILPMAEMAARVNLVGGHAEVIYAD